MSQSADKARLELERIGEEPKIIDWYCRVIDEYYSIGHSGGSHFISLPILVKLLNQENLTEITNDPTEWMNIKEYSGYPHWQNSRNSKAFSEDGGATYTLVSDKRKKNYTAKASKV